MVASDIGAQERSTERWFVVTVTSPSEETKPILAEGLVAMGAGGAEEDGRALRAWLPEPQDPQGTAAAMASRLAELAGEPVEVSWEWRDGADWDREWRRGLAPRRVGARFVVTPSWCAYEPLAGDRVLVIDPEMAFGTGEHATTRGCLRLLESVVAEGAAVLDVGTGSGVLAIAAAALGATRVDAIDSDPVAIDAAVRNAERNRVGERIRFAVEEALPSGLDARPDGSYDLITANILSSILMPILPSFRRLVRPGGAVVLGGILRSEAAAMEAALAAAGLTLEVADEEEEWWSARARRE